MINTICWNCGRRLGIADVSAGSWVKCPNCSKSVPVPTGIPAHSISRRDNPVTPRSDANTKSNNDSIAASEALYNAAASGHPSPTLDATSGISPLQDTLQVHEHNRDHIPNLNPPSLGHSPTDVPQYKPLLIYSAACTIVGAVSVIVGIALGLALVMTIDSRNMDDRFTAINFSFILIGAGLGSVVWGSVFTALRDVAINTWHIRNNSQINK